MLIGFFPSGSGSSGGGGIPIAPVSGIKTLTCSEKVYIKWTDPEDTIVGDATLAKWAGTLLVRKAGAMPSNRRDGTVVLDNKERNAYKDQYFCDNGVSNGETYYYKFFPYSNTNTYTDDPADEFTATPNPVETGDVSNLRVVAQLNERVQLTWNDPDEKVIQDGVTLATWASTKVVYKTDGYPTSPDDGELVINSVTRNEYSSSPLTVNGLTNGTTYYFAVFPITTEGTANTNTAGRITAIPNKIKITTMPTQKNIPTYNGNQQTPEWNNYDPAQMTISAEKQTDAGNYEATVTPTPDYCWNDGTSEPQTLTWKINQGTGTLTVSPSTVTLDPSHLSATFTIGGNHDGTLNVVSNGTNIATVSRNDHTVTVNNVNKTSGKATITVSCTAGKNYTKPSDATVSVEAKFVSDKLDENDWATIRSVSDEGQWANYWSVGDGKKIRINGTIGLTTITNYDVYAFILGFDHNKNKETPNNHAIHFQIGRTAEKADSGAEICLIDSTYNSYNANNGSFTMNPAANSSGSKNAGGWNSSHMRTTLLGSNGNPLSPAANTFLNALPQDLRAVMKPCIKYSDNTGGGSDNANYVTTTTDYLFLLSEFEVQGARTYANSAEQNNQLQYEYYKTGNRKIRYQHTNTSTAAPWWLRSVIASNTTSFCFVYTNGSASIANSGTCFGVAPAFCV